MSLPGKPDPLGDLPVLTEVVVPSPSGIKMPESSPLPDDHEASISTATVTVTETPVAEEDDSLWAAESFAKTASFPVLSPQYSDLPSFIDDEDDGLEIAAEEDFPEQPPATQGEDVAAAFSEIREALVDALQKRFAIEIPTLVEAALQNALPMITNDIREGLEENAKLALKDLIVSLNKKSSSAKKT